MSRKNAKFYKSTSTEDQLKNINNCFKRTGKLSKDLATGKFSQSWFAGTSMEPLDTFRASQVALQEMDSAFLRNAIISMLYNNHCSHHSISAFLAAHFLSHKTKVTKKDIMKKSKCATKIAADKFYSSLIRDERTFDLFKQVREAAGTSARITFRITPAKEDAVTLNRNNLYPLSVPEEFWRHCSKDHMEMVNVSVLAVDGIVMTVGEINGFLLSANSNKQPLIIICRGMTEEVLATLLKNYSTGKLNVFPIQVASDEESNLLYDFASLAGADVVSTITGDVLASKDEECLGKLPLAIIFKDQIEIKVDSKRAQHLFKKIEHERNKYISEFGPCGEFLDIFDLRKSAASSEVCKVYVSNCSIGQEHVIIDRLKSLTLVHNEIKENGVVDIKDFNCESFKKLSNMGFSTMPVTSLIYAIKSSSTLREKILESSRILILD